jgi:hypothetical protein
MKVLRIVNFYAEPLGGYKPYNEVMPLITFHHKDIFAKLNKIIGISSYKAHEGADLHPAGIYRVRIIENIDEKSALIENLVERGRRTRVDLLRTVVEKNFLYPILESGSISRWRVSNYAISIIPYDRNGKIILEPELKVKWPKTYEYFSRFKKILEQRSDYKSYGKRQPFYFIYKLANHTLSPVKVIWNTMGTKLEAVVVTLIKDKSLGEKIAIPDHVFAYISVNSEDEAHYICSILNSSLVNLILQSKTKGGKNFAPPKIINMINIRQFDQSNPFHRKLVELSKKAHQLAQQGQEYELRNVEKEIDRTVAQLYGISEDELIEIKRCLAILEGEESEEEIEEVPEAIPDVFIENPLLYEGSPQELELTVVNPYEEPLKDIKVKLELADLVFEEVFEELSGERRLRIPLGRLSLGEYKVKISMEYRLGDSVKRVEKEVPLYVRSSEVRFVERGGLDSILGEGA